MLCKSCGGNVKSDFKYCPFCGERIISDFHDQFEELPPSFVIDAALADDEPEPMHYYDPDTFDTDMGAEPPRFESDAPFDPDDLDGETPYFVYQPDQAGAFAKAPAPPRRPTIARETNAAPPRPTTEREVQNNAPGLGFKAILIVLLLLVAATITVFGYQIFVAQVPFGISGLAAMLY